MDKCKTCLRRYEHRTAFPCRYCIHNSERFQYFCRSLRIADKDYYIEVKIDEKSDIPF